MATTDEIRRALAVAGAAYPATKILKQTVEIWCRLLGDLPDGSVEAAVLDYLGQANPFFPAPGVIRQKAIALTCPSAALSAPEAWSEVRQAMRQIGSYGTPEFSTTAVEKAVAAVGGWRYLCLSEEMVADRARFLQAFEIIQKREMDDAWMMPEVKQLLSGEPKPKELPSETKKMSRGLR